MIDPATGSRDTTKPLAQMPYSGRARPSACHRPRISVLVSAIDLGENETDRRLVIRIVR